MHQKGIGLTKDYLLAKRYYDLAAEFAPEEAYVPSYLSLWYLTLDQTTEYLRGMNSWLAGKRGRKR